MNSTKYTHEWPKENSRVEQGPRRKGPGRSITDPLSYYCTTLTNKKSTMIQTPGYGHACQRVSKGYPTSGKMSVKWRAQTSTHVSINPSQEPCIKNCVISTDTHEQTMRHQVK